RRLVETPVGRSLVLRQIADAEGNGENRIFEHVLDAVSDREVRRMVEKHKADELGHERLFLDCAARAGDATTPVPASLRIIERIDRAAGDIFARNADRRVSVMEAYLMLQTIEERAVRDFATYVRVFDEVDAETASVLRGVARDEERHLRYCDAISRRYA